jgi:hypothetical protein
MRLVGIHRRFIAHCYRRVCPAVALCKAESCTMAAGFVSEAVKRRQACYNGRGDWGVYEGQNEPKSTVSVSPKAALQPSPRLFGQSLGGRL